MIIIMIITLLIRSLLNFPSTEFGCESDVWPYEAHRTDDAITGD
jgi:hypothetical protein